MDKTWTFEGVYFTGYRFFFDSAEKAECCATPISIYTYKEKHVECTQQLKNKQSG